MVDAGFHCLPYFDNEEEMYAESIVLVAV